MKNRATSEVHASKKPYKKPSLQEFGAIKRTTRGSGTANGDGGMSMMA